ncbi:Membrane protein [Streptococcus thermophilus]|uniref:Membrane protein n=3 Tax=Streptococcus TaxID=1301 RepID=A0A2X3UKT4_STRTR|nr:TMEM175 family protein [Streptococcus thermophilus]TDG56774.1 hypothetical protein C4K59_000713 [Streptococcus thermophilus]UEC17493.1 DUF1211 domain-containing protein [Streptococcus thermophilus LMD-9]CAD0130860.1 Membrane protein [Streptococcus thermophilus]SQF25615.1 membrane protein [Streptococcus thermophilus]
MLQNERRCNPMKKDRLIALTDAVLAIIMTILILELEKPTTPSLQAFWDLRQNFFAYFLSFFWLGWLWMILNTLWEKVEKISQQIVWWNLFLLFFVSFMPYATGIVSSHFMNHTAQLFYGLIVIVSTVANWFLHKVIDKPNMDQKELLEATAQYRKLLIPDLIIKGVGLILSLIVYPPIMIYSVLIAAFYIIILKTLSEKRVNN